MTQPQWARAKALFQAAVEQPMDQREAFVAAATGGDDALRTDVESLLISDSTDAGFLDRLSAGGAAMVDDAINLAPSDVPLPRVGLPTGARIGPYRIVGALGAGAMGDVYRAFDTNLNREIALKVLPGEFASDGDRLARFKREAQLLATLNHPNIAAIYGLDESDGSPGLVLELVEGPTLAERIALGPLAVDEALAIARQMCDALEAAHDKGIIHRDLKPANIKLAADGVVKVLDFGLARVWDGAPHSDLSVSPRVTATDLGCGVLAGTPTYMSPEQARGKPLDRRTDIWSFGCVVYEMLTGRAPFAADTISDTFAAVLHRNPDETLLPADTPAPVRRLLRRCLEKNRKARLDSAAGARLEIDDALASPAAEPFAAAAAPSRSETRIWATVAVLFAVVAVAGFLMRQSAQPASVPPPLASRFAIVLPAEPPLNVSGFDRDLALSPDGRQLVYRAGGSFTAGSPLMVRAIDQLEAQPIGTIVNAYAPFFSPDSRWLGFFEKQELKKISIAGGPVITLCAVSGAPLGASWGDDNAITFATDSPNTGLWRVSADGGAPAPVTTPDPAQHERYHAFPSVLPHGRGVLFTVATSGQVDGSQVAVLDLSTGQRKTLIRGGGDAQYVETGHLVFAAGGALRAVRFDLARLAVLGEPVTIVEHVVMKLSGAANYAVSTPGTLVYVPGDIAGQMPMRSLVWVDRAGHEAPVKAPLRPYSLPRVSPDGTRVAVGIHDRGNTEIWIWEVARETLRRLTFASGINGMPLWTPDGRTIVFMSNRMGVVNLYQQAADGTGTIDRLTESPNQQWPISISADATRVFGFDLEPKKSPEVIVVPLTASSPHGRGTSAGRTARNLFRGAFAEISPDGRYLAYQSDESGRNEVYVRPFPDVDSGRWQISSAGGTRPAWARNGRELFFLDLSNTFTAAAVETSGATFVAGRPAKLFDAKYVEPNPARHYDVSPDARRFLMLKDSPPSDANITPASMVVVEHWFGELQRQVPANAK